MEDRATARIKAAFLRNWLRHSIITTSEFLAMVEEVSKEIPDVNEVVKNAILELVLNPENRLNALVEHAFMKGYLAARPAREEEDVLFSSWSPR